MLLIVIALLFAFLALHPFISFPISLRYLGRRVMGIPGGVPPAGPRATVSVCMCAYNEAAVIVAKAHNLLALKERSGGDVELLVYVDGGTDDTAKLLEPFRDSITVIAATERHGKSHGMRRLAAQARGELLVFTDANVMIDPEAINALRRHFADPRVGCVCGHLVYGNAVTSDTSEVNSAYWRLEESIKKLESERGMVIGADGSLFAVRRELNPPVPDDIIDDFFVSLSILCDGYRVIRGADVLAYEESVVDSGEEFRRKIRISCQAFNVHRLLWPRLRALPALPLYCYVSHKLLRWFVAPNLILAGLFFLAALMQWVHPALVLGGLAVLAAAWFAALALGVGPVRKIWEIWLAFLATALGVLRSLRGDRFQTWSPAQSIRGGAPLTGAAGIGKSAEGGR
ncbi:glycosyltransferase [Muricoccus pecuniae]|uniref:Cellulose synthase/poly-beta-1,6-N-acetylglucosamine synthase-like glycosyltransferase n=1 Tax=Muricoccus pecuniae TaxID=693023 RepID=A0A840YHB5_9PROT|nr:glycosyltransferase [Roseomonas pecuniae]MBB5693912.1 cellulose synthase/poly-beta-1,6-N-acetylglucosamine synthase-like glycosyltransferase [Roseomonas pecuniae]